MPRPAVWGGGGSNNIAVAGSNNSIAAGAFGDADLTTAATTQTLGGASNRGHAGSRAPRLSSGASRVVGRTFKA